MIKVRILGIICIFTACVTACGENSPKMEQSSGQYCFSDGATSCESKMQNGIAILKLEQPLAIETPLQVNLNTNMEFRVTSVSAELVGENMYMGSMPLLFKPDEEGEWAANLMVVACSRPDMIWRIQSKITLEDGSEQDAFWLFEVPR